MRIGIMIRAFEKSKKDGIMYKGFWEIKERWYYA